MKGSIDPREKRSAHNWGLAGSRVIWLIHVRRAQSISHCGKTPQEQTYLLINGQIGISHQRKGRFYNITTPY